MEPRDEPLAPDLVDPDPLVQFATWFGAAIAAGVRQPEAMTLATVDADGRPDARTVLLRGQDRRGLAFFTNLESAKARQLAAVPAAAAVFHWREMERQVRITGPVRRLPGSDAERYWETRPIGHRLSAWASPQSDVVDADELTQRVRAIEARFADTSPPLPPFWGGYIIGVDTLELWQGRANRLHDRVRYRRVEGAFVRERLAP